MTESLERYFLVITEQGSTITRKFTTVETNNDRRHIFKGVEYYRLGDCCMEMLNDSVEADEFRRRADQCGLPLFVFIDCGYGWPYDYLVEVWNFWKATGEVPLVVCGEFWMELVAPLVTFYEEISSKARYRMLRAKYGLEFGNASYCLKMELKRRGLFEGAVK